MLDRIAVNFANLPAGYYKDAILALPATEEASGEVDRDYLEFRNVFGKVLQAMQPGGRIKVGKPREQFTKDAVLAGFLIETENDQVHPLTNSTYPSLSVIYLW
jgi:anamorsin